MGIPAYHESIEEVEEHGQAWQVCGPCGAIWDGEEEEVEAGDGSCAERAQ